MADVRRAGAFLLGSAVTYAAAAACSGGGTSVDPSPVAATGAAAGLASGGVVGAAGTSGGTSAGGGAGFVAVVDAGLDAVADAVADVADPVPDARAEAGAGGQAGQSQSGGGPGCAICSCDCPAPVYVVPEPEIVEAPCVPPAGSGLPVAELLRPGRTAAQLSAVRWIMRKASHYPSFPTGYDNTSGVGGYVKDGALAIQCATSSDSVTFIIPGE